MWRRRQPSEWCNHKNTRNLNQNRPFSSYLRISQCLLHAVCPFLPCIFSLLLSFPTKYFHRRNIQLALSQMVASDFWADWNRGQLSAHIVSSLKMFRNTDGWMPKKCHEFDYMYLRGSPCAPQLNSILILNSKLILRSSPRNFFNWIAQTLEINNRLEAANERCSHSAQT